MGKGREITYHTLSYYPVVTSNPQMRKNHLEVEEKHSVIFGVANRYEIGLSVSPSMPW